MIIGNVRGLRRRARRAAALPAAAAALAAALGGPGAEAQPIRLAKPIDCVFGQTCSVQNYVDHDPGRGAKDFTCGPRTFDHHTGTDIRIRDLAAMRKGVPVLAAASGRVRRVRDGMADVSFRKIGDAAIKGRSCGNAAVIDHGDGWETIYCHMRRGSVRVRPGQPVSVGQQIGLVGLSGRTEFPHVHFEVRHNRHLIDPFVGAEPVGACGGPRKPLWRNPIADGLVYQPASVIGVGFTDRRPTPETLEAGENRQASLSGAAPQLIFWVRVVGVKPGDRQALEIVRPDGRVLARANPKDVDRPKALYWAYVGKRQHGEGWPPGKYEGAYRLVRDGRLLLQKFTDLQVK